MAEKTSSQIFLLDTAAIWVKEKIHIYKIPLIASWIFGLLAHFFAFTNKLVNFDEVGSLFDKGTTASSGRWGLDILTLVFPNRSMPWIYGIIAIGLMSFSVCLIIHIFRIRHSLLQVLLAGCILSFPSLTATVSFMYTLTSYATSFFLAVLSVELIQRKSVSNYFAALVSLVFSLSIYQSYISIASSFFVLLLIQMLLQNETIADIIKHGFHYLTFLILSLGLYYGLMKLINCVCGIPMNDYANGRMIFSFSDIPANIVEAYRAFAQFFMTRSYGMMPDIFSRIVHVLCFISCIVLLIFWGLQQKRNQLVRFGLLAIFIALLPLAINCIFLFVSADPYLSAIHTLVLYSFTSLYILAVIIAETCTPPPNFYTENHRFLYA